MLRILSDSEVLLNFGNPAPYVRLDGSVSLAWESGILTRVPLPEPIRYLETGWVHHFRAHHRVAGLLERAFEEIHDDPDAWASINDFGGCYSFRQIRGSKKLSRHSWGIAVDMDCADNPFLGLVPRVHPRVKAIMESNGFAWGGARIWGGSFPWGRRDAMHFEFADLSLLG
jgi:hypothetical protein